MSVVVRSFRAKSDLLDIWLHIASDSVTNADGMLSRIERVLERVAQFPYSGRERPEIATAVRSEVVGRYLLPYRVNGEQVQLLRVIDGSRDLSDLLDL